MFYFKMMFGVENRIKLKMPLRIKIRFSIRYFWYFEFLEFLGYLFSFEFGPSETHNSKYCRTKSIQHLFQVRISLNSFLWDRVRFRFSDLVYLLTLVSTFMDYCLLYTKWVRSIWGHQFTRLSIFIWA